MDNSAARLYGKGVFTTIAIFESEPFLWEKHWRRLSDNAEKLGVDISDLSKDAVRNSLIDQIDKQKIFHGRARVTFYDERTSPIWPGRNLPDRATSLSIIVSEDRPVFHNAKLTISPFNVNSRSPLSGVKSCNYLENILSIEEVKGRGFDEAVRVNEKGHVTSACLANVFWLKNEQLFTPSLETGCLAGTTREFVIENIECEEIEVGVEELGVADSIYLTSAGLGVLAVNEFDGRGLRRDDHSILRLIDK